MAELCFTFYDTVQLLTKAVVAFGIPADNMWVSLLFYIFINTWPCQPFKLHAFLWVQRSIIYALICTSFVIREGEILLCAYLPLWSLQIFGPLIGLFFSLLLTYTSPSCILSINPFKHICFVKIFIQKWSFWFALFCLGF